jgi:CubicO group peptidase (beta-lactamase class C family)/C-terminal processing protease CtpA/Prc
MTKSMRACGALLLFLFAVAPARSEPEELRVQRLAALGQVWGAIEWFHPKLANSNIDWEGALERAIVRIDAETTEAQYRQAVASMLAELNDPATRVLPPGNVSGSSSVVVAPSARWTEDRIAVLAVPDPNYFAADYSHIATLEKMFADARAANAVILDLRGNPRSDPWNDRVVNEAFAGLIGDALATLLGTDLRLSGIRYRMHSGHAPEGESTSGGYFSALVVREGPIIKTHRPAPERPPLIVVTDAEVTHWLPLLGSLQSSGLASVIHVGDHAVAGPAMPMQLPGLMVNVRAGEAVHADGCSGFQPDLLLPASSEHTDRAMQAALKAARGGGLVHTPHAVPTALKLDSVAKMPEPDYPSRERRLLALFRLWNAIHYFFPYQSLMERSWEDLLATYIPRFEAAGDATDYHLTVAQLVTHLQDSHVTASSAVLARYFGDTLPSVRVKFIERQTVVTGVWDAAATRWSALRVGDVIVAVDGEESAARRARLGKYFSASTPQALEYKIDQAMLAGPAGSRAVLSVRDRHGKQHAVTLRRDGAPPPARTGAPYSVIDRGYGYIDLTRLMPQDVDAAFKAVEHTPGLILDMRGYPRGVFFDLAAHLASKPAIAARFERPEVDALTFQEPLRRTFTQSVMPGSGPPYRGVVTMLINEEAISQSEHTALFVEAATDVTFIGGASNGANGDVTFIDLPGGISVKFSGHDVRHGDGRQLQRVGIQPHIVSRPTVAGLRAGRDEVLDSAIGFLRSAGARRNTAADDALWECYVREFDAYMSANRIVGGATVWMRDGQIVARRDSGLADIEMNQPVDVDSIFQYGSITKTLVAVTVMQLRDRGELSLDDPVVRYIPELRQLGGDQAWAERITLRMLLNHTSGLPIATWPWKQGLPWEPFEPTRWEQLVGMLPYQQLAFEPGSRMRYSNPAFIYLARVVETVTGEPWLVYVQKNIFAPLGMTRSYFSATPRHLLEHRSNNYSVRRATDGEVRTVANGKDFNPGITNPNGGWNAPLADVVKYLGFLTSYAKASPTMQRQYDQILKRSTLEEMWVPQPPRSSAVASSDAAGDLIGLSFFLHPRADMTIVGHTGSQAGFHSFLLFNPASGAGVVAVFNTSSEQGNRHGFEALQEQSMQLLRRER